MKSTRGNSCRWIAGQLAELAQKAPLQIMRAGEVTAGYAYISLQSIRHIDEFPQKDAVKESAAFDGSVADLIASGAAIIDSFVFMARYGSQLNNKEKLSVLASTLLCVGSVYYSASNLGSTNQAGTSALVATASGELSNFVRYCVWKRQRVDIPDAPEATQSLLRASMSSNA